MKTVMLGTVGALALAAASFAQDVVAPAGVYTLDKDHATITWMVKHFNTSTYVAGFDDFDAALTFDPENPAASTLSVTIDVLSLDLDFENVINPAAPDAFYNELLGIPQDTPGRVFFRAPSFPTITFEATGIEVTGENTGTVTGDMTMLGVTKPLTLDVTFNGVRSFGGPAIIGFSATTTVKRSEWGMTELTDPPLVGDDVTVLIEAEFNAAP